jgi:pimeloyl-ACP methyl ester carboxylesterase
MREAGQILKQMSSAQFTRLTDEQWEKMAHGTWSEDGDGLTLNYDPNLMKTLQAIDLEQPLPILWPLFEGLKPFPVLAIRGGNSDLLTDATLQAMREKHPRLTAITVPDQGHAPFFEGDLIGAVKNLIADAETHSPECVPAE